MTIRFTKVFFSFLFLFLGISQAFAQTTTLPAVYGRVIDAQTGEPLKGAVIALDFKKSGTKTDSLGNYKVHLPYGEYVIKISYVGYNPFRTRIQLKKDEQLNVELNDVTKQLEEVIVSSSSTKKDIQTPSLGVTILSLDRKSVV